MKVSILEGPAELKAASLAMKKADKDIRRQINQNLRNVFNPIWKQSLQNQGIGMLALGGRVMLAGARIRPGNPPAFIAASSKRQVKGTRIYPLDSWQAFEYGASHSKITKYTRKTKHGTHQVSRHVTYHLPPRRSKGYIAAPVMEDLRPRIASFWIQSVIKAYMDALDRKN